MKIVRCTSKECGVSDTFDDAPPDGWMYVKADPPPAVANPNITIKSFHGVCPGCVAAEKRTLANRKVSGGTKFDTAELEAGGRVVVDRQGKLF